MFHKKLAFWGLLLGWVGLTVIPATVRGQTTELPSIVLSGHSDRVMALAWSPDGSLLASSAGDWDSVDNSIRLWHTDGSLVAVLDGHSEPVDSLAWSPNGELLASGSQDGTVGLWKPDGTLVRTITTDIGVVFQVAWSPDGKVLAAGGLKGTSQNGIQLWTPDGTLIKALKTNFSGGKFYNMGWSPDGKYIAGGAIDYSEWTADGRLVFTHEECSHCTPFWGFAWSPDSTRWAMGNESGEVFIHAIDGTQIAKMQNEGNADALAWSPDGKILAGGDRVMFWRADGTAIRTVGAGTGRTFALAWSPDGQRLAIASQREYVFIVDDQGAILGRIAGHQQSVRQVAWSPDGQLLASGSDDHTIRLWKRADMP